MLNMSRKHSISADMALDLRQEPTQAPPKAPKQNRREGGGAGFFQESRPTSSATTASHPDDRPIFISAPPAADSYRAAFRLDLRRRPGYATAIMPRRAKSTMSPPSDSCPPLRAFRRHACPSPPRRRRAPRPARRGDRREGPFGQRRRGSEIYISRLIGSCLCLSSVTTAQFDLAEATRIGLASLQCSVACVPVSLAAFQVRYSQVRSSVAVLPSDGDA